MYFQLKTSVKNMNFMAIEYEWPVAFWMVQASIFKLPPISKYSSTVYFLQLCTGLFNVLNLSKAPLYVN